MFYSLGTLQNEQTELFRHKTYLALNLWNMFLRVTEADHYQAHEIYNSKDFVWRKDVPFEYPKC